MPARLRQLRGWGGEEFLVLLPEADLAAAVTVAEKMRGRLSRTIIGAVAPATPPTVSVGVAVHGAGESLRSLLTRADAAMYEAKRLGRDRIEVAPAPA